jgi:cytochrome c
MLRVTDDEGNSNQTETEILVGNELPEVSWEIVNGNSSFYWPNEELDIEYNVAVNDVEDGSLAKGNLDPSLVTVSFNYLAQGSDNIIGAKSHAEMASSAYASIGKTLIEGSDCLACHKEKDVSIGPSYFDIAQRYAEDETAPESLAGKIINGGAGNWGETAMAAHPSVTDAEAKQMAEYILSLYEDPDAQTKRQPTRGRYKSSEHIGATESGSYLLTASYTDKGGGVIEPLTGQKMMVLKHPRQEAEAYDEGSASKMNITPDMVPGLEEDMGIVIGLKDSYMMFKHLDLTGVKAVGGTFAVTSAFVKGGHVEIRIGGLEGELLGTIPIEVALTGMELKALAITLNKEVTGKQDVYFIFKNDGEDAGAMLTAVDAIEFFNKAAGN